MNSQTPWLDLVRRVHPDATDDECHTLLWACSPYPFAKPSHVLQALRAVWERGGRTADGAVKYSHDELDAAMSEMRKT